MPVCIIGMHRSGTSMVAQLLNRCGLYLGPDDALIGPLESNPLGHFENIGFFRINEALLRHFGGSWDDPPDLREGWEQGSSLEGLAQEARSLVQRFTAHPYWGWKDPRTTLFVPFWRRVVSDIRFVICIRNPLEVAESLARRDGIPFERGLYLGNVYTRAAISDTRGAVRIFAFYEDFFGNSISELKRIVDSCNLGLPNDLTDLGQVISSDLRHNVKHMGDVLSDKKMTTEHKLFYIGLRAIVHPASKEAGYVEDQENLLSEKVDAFLNLIDALREESKLAKLESAISEKDQQIIRLCENLKDEEKSMIEKERQLAVVQAWADKVTHSIPYRIYRFLRLLKRTRE